MFASKIFKQCGFAIVAAMMTISAASANSSATAPPSKLAPGNIAIGETVPSYLGIDRENTKINAPDYVGKVLVVTFWASWCGPCLKELQVLENLQNTAKTNVQVIAINIEERDKFKSVSRALSALNLKLAHDYSKSVAEKFGVKGIPHMLIIGRDGKVLNVHRGYGDGMIPRLAAEINAAMTMKLDESSTLTTTKTESSQ
jgi:thiol-disulfide isomerase/thioredoxin